MPSRLWCALQAARKVSHLRDSCKIVRTECAMSSNKLLIRDRSSSECSPPECFPFSSVNPYIGVSCWRARHGFTISHQMTSCVDTYFLRAERCKYLFVLPPRKTTVRGGYCHSESKSQIPNRGPLDGKTFHNRIISWIIVCLDSLYQPSPSRASASGESVGRHNDIQRRPIRTTCFVCIGIARAAFDITQSATPAQRLP